MCGDFFSNSTNRVVWKNGEIVECQLPKSGHSLSTWPEKRAEILVCGSQTRLAWGQMWFKGDIRDQIYADATTFDVTFHSTGHPGPKGGYGPAWWCRKVPQGIDCE